MVYVSHLQDRLLTPTARILLALTMNPNMSQTMLAARLGISRRHVIRYLGDLERASYISVDRSQMNAHGCVYTVHLSETERAALRALSECEEERQARPVPHGRGSEHRE